MSNWLLSWKNLIFAMGRHFPYFVFLKPIKKAWKALDCKSLQSSTAIQNLLKFKFICSHFTFKLHSVFSSTDAALCVEREKQHGLVCWFGWGLSGYESRDKSQSTGFIWTFTHFVKTTHNFSFGSSLSLEPWNTRVSLKGKTKRDD